MARGRRRADWMPICRLLNLIDARVRLGITRRPLEPVEYLPDDLRDGMEKAAIPQVTAAQLAESWRGNPGYVEG